MKFPETNCLEKLSGTLLQDKNIDHVVSKLLMPNGKLRLLEAKQYDELPREEVRLFCHKYARYGLPTFELITFLKDIIGTRSAIEIGAGYGDLGYHLGIPMTDSKIQSGDVIRLLYSSMKQPPIEYPDDVEKLEALEAIEKYKPQVVVGSWVTQWINPDLPPPPGGGSIFGIKEKKLLKQVEAYIVIGNLAIHGNKKILKNDHYIINNVPIRSRSSRPELDRIFIWGK